MIMKSTSNSAAAFVALLCAAVKGRRMNSLAVLIIPIAVGLSGVSERGAGFAFARPMPDHPVAVEGLFADRLRRDLEDRLIDVSRCGRAMAPKSSQGNI